MLGEVISSAISVINNILIFSGGYYRDGIYALLFSVVPFFIYVALSYVMIFNPAVFIDKMKLDQEFYEEQFTMSMDKHVVMRMAVIIVGLYLLISATPDLFRELIAYYQNSVNNVFSETRNYKAQGIAYTGTKVMAAYIMLTNSTYIANFINKKETNNPD